MFLYISLILLISSTIQASYILIWYRFSNFEKNKNRTRDRQIFQHIRFAFKYILLQLILKIK